MLSNSCVWLELLESSQEFLYEYLAILFFLYNINSTCILQENLTYINPNE